MPTYFRTPVPGPPGVNSAPPGRPPASPLGAVYSPQYGPGQPTTGPLAPPIGAVPPGPIGSPVSPLPPVQPFGQPSIRPPVPMPFPSPAPGPINPRPRTRPPVYVGPPKPSPISPPPPPQPFPWTPRPNDLRKRVRFPPGYQGPPTVEVDPAQEHAAAVARFGSFPAQADPNAPKPPIIAGAENYNPFTGTWSR